MPETLNVGGLALTVCNAPAAAAPRPPLLFLHGMFGGAWMFEEWQPFFAERGWTSYALDFRGHGASAASDPGALSVRDYGDDAIAAAAFLEGRHGTKPLVVGHSMGGLMAQQVAEANAASAVVLMSSAPPRGIPALSLTVMRRMIPHLGALLGSRPFTMTFADAEAIALNGMRPADRAALYERMTPESGRIARELAIGAVSVDARRVACPVIAVTAAHDHFVPWRVGRKIARKYHAPHWHYAEHAHHFLAEPGWERIAGDVERWLAHVTQRAGQPARDEALWKDLKGSIGDLVELEFFDGYRVRAEIVSVDLAARQRVVYEPVETRAPGARARYMAHEDDDVEWSPLVELVGLQALPGM